VVVPPLAPHRGDVVAVVFEAPRIGLRVGLPERIAGHPVGGLVRPGRVDHVLRLLVLPDVLQQVRPHHILGDAVVEAVGDLVHGKLVTRFQVLDVRQNLVTDSVGYRRDDLDCRRLAVAERAEIPTAGLQHVVVDEELVHCFTSDRFGLVRRQEHGLVGPNLTDDGVEIRVAVVLDVRFDAVHEGRSAR